MGIYASVVIHPVGGRPPVRDRLEPIARDIVRAFERAELLVPGTADATPASPENRVVGHEELPAGVTGVNLAVDGRAFLPGIARLIYTRTWGEHYDGLGLAFPEGVTADHFVFPLLDVAVYTKTVRATHFDGDLACRAWAMVEFSFEDIRVNLDVAHRIRDEEHPLFQELATVLKTEVGWAVVMY
jgi:hypothetical protein